MVIKQSSPEANERVEGSDSCVSKSKSFPNSQIIYPRHAQNLRRRWRSGRKKDV